MGNRLLHQSNAARGVRALPARSEDHPAGGKHKKINRSPWVLGAGCPGGKRNFAILTRLARYPSGPRERSAKPPFVGSNPTRASNCLVVPQSGRHFPACRKWLHFTGSTICT